LSRELLRIVFILFQKDEKPALLYTQDLLDVLSFNLLVGITLQKLFHLVWGKTFVYLGHNLRPPLGFQTISLISKSEAAELFRECYESSEILPFGLPRSTQRALG
jgi:hypothetical protein